MIMAITSCSTIAISKLYFSFSFSQTIYKKISINSIPFCSKKYVTKKLFFSIKNPKSCVYVSNSLVNDCSIDETSKENNSQVSLNVSTSTWNWRGYSIRYQYCGNNGPALVLVHGFGANSDHWRKNLPVLAQSHRVFSIDLIGYGYSDKPNPRELGVDNFYTFETWGCQLNDFCKDVVRDKAFFICNSIGGLVGLQAAVLEPQLCRGILLLNISLRMLHITKQPWFAKSLIKAFQNLLRNTALGKFFFRSVATPESVKNILRQCYYDTSQVTDELVQSILLPGLEPGAVDVFLEFICYSAGPLPEELLPQVKCPVLVAWGDKDPWEPIELGKAYGKFDTVEDFVVLPNVGHCPQDEAPHLVNPLVESFVARHAN
ncbi:putative hydrolase YugF [Capsicum galapagoense]